MRKVLLLVVLMISITLLTGCQMSELERVEKCIEDEIPNRSQYYECSGPTDAPMFDEYKYGYLCQLNTDIADENQEYDYYEYMVMISEEDKYTLFGVLGEGEFFPKLKINCGGKDVRKGFLK